MHRRLLFIYLPWQTLRILQLGFIITVLFSSPFAESGLQSMNQSAVSLFFIIDHSGSMFEYDYDSTTSTLYTPVDPQGNRFKVTRDLIDTLSNNPKYPGIEVGVAVFGSGLYWDSTDGFTVDVEGEPGVGPFEDGCYIPLLKLDKDYNGKTGAEIIKEKLHTKTNLDTFITEPDPIVYEWVDLTAPTPSFWGNATNINIGFIAAKKAMRASTNDPENHYCIFLSDGKNSFGSSTDYIQGVDVPTTFTIFLTKTEQVPQELITMNENIQNNGYSVSNPLSNLWEFHNTGYDTLMSFIKQNIIELIYSFEAPELIQYNSPTYERRPLLKWKKPPEAGSNYTIQIDTTSSFGAPIITVPVVDTFYTPSIDLPIGTIYWRVKSDVSSWSQTGSFVILDNRVPALIPYTPDITNNTTPTLKWRSVANAASYTIQVDNNSDFSSPILTLPVADTSLTPSAPLPLGDIYWHVKSDLIDTWSAADHFFILADSIPFLLRFNGQNIPNPRPEFKWHPVTGATSYKILIADNSDFNNAITFPLTDTICILQTDLALGKWFWKVSCSKDLELYSPVDSLIIDVTGLLPEISQHTGQGVRFIQSHKDLRIILGGNNSKNVVADIYNIKGRVVSTLTSNNNRHNALYWNFNDRQGMAVPSGMYVVRVKTPDKVYMRRVIVSK